MVSNIEYISSNAGGVPSFNPEIHLDEITRVSSYKPEIHLDDISRYVMNLVDLARTDEFIEGEISKTQMYLETLYKDAPELFGEVFNRAWLKLFGGNHHDLYTFASIASNIPYEWLRHNADTLMLGCSGHAEPSINEASLRMAESWEQSSFVAYLNQIRSFGYDWLEDYKVAVISYLEGLNE